jgi:hypothetical protein
MAQRLRGIRAFSERASGMGGGGLQRHHSASREKTAFCGLISDF